MGVGEGPHVLDGLEELAHAAVGEGLTLQGDDDGIGGGEPVDGEDAQRGRAVDEHHVVVVPQRFEGPFKDVLTAGPGKEMDLRASQVDGGRHHVEAVHPGHSPDDLGHALAPNEDVVERPAERIGIEAEGEGQARLRVEVDHQGPSPELGRRHPQGVHGGRLGHAPLLVGHRQDLGHAGSLRNPVPSAPGVRSRPSPPLAR